MWRFDIGGGRNVSQKWMWNRSGHAVSPLRNRHFWPVLGVVGVSIGFSTVSGREAATIWGQNHDFAGHPNLILPFSRVRLLKPHRYCVFSCHAMFCFYSGFKRDVLTPGVGEMCLKNRFVCLKNATTLQGRLPKPPENSWRWEEKSRPLHCLPNLCRCRCRLSFANLSFFWDSFWGSAALGGSP